MQDLDFDQAPVREQEKQAGGRALGLGTSRRRALNSPKLNSPKEVGNTKTAGQTARRRRSGNVVTLRSNRRMTA
jgi:hypothetical protein